MMVLSVVTSASSITCELVAEATLMANPISYISLGLFVIFAGMD